MVPFLATILTKLVTWKWEISTLSYSLSWANRSNDVFIDWFWRRSLIQRVDSGHSGDFHFLRILKHSFCVFLEKYKISTYSQQCIALWCLFPKLCHKLWQWFVIQQWTLSLFEKLLHAKYTHRCVRGFNSRRYCESFCNSKENSNGSAPRCCNVNSGFIFLFKSEMQSTDNSTWIHGNITNWKLPHIQDILRTDRIWKLVQI